MKNLKKTCFTSSILFIIILAFSVASVTHAVKVIDSIKVGGLPVALAYDSGRNEVFVANYELNDVDVISDGNYKVVATVAVGEGPIAVTYDSGKGEIFVANIGSNTVSVISDSNNSVIATVPVRGNATDVVYDSSKSEIFVINTGLSIYQISVISDSNNTVIATIPLIKCINLAYDTGKSEVFVVTGPQGLSSTGIASVISDSNNSVIANVTVGDVSGGIAYDSGKNEVFVANTFNDTLAVITDNGNVVVATVPAGITYPSSLVYDPATSEIFVSSAGQNTVSIISDANDTVVGNMNVGDVSSGIAYDSGNGEIFVGTEISGTPSSGDVSVLSVSSGTSLSSNPSQNSSVPEFSNQAFILVVIVMVVVTFCLVAQKIKKIDSH